MNNYAVIELVKLTGRFLSESCGTVALSMLVSWGR